MQYVLFKNGQAVYLTNEQPFTGTPKLAELKTAAGEVIDYDNAENSFRLDSFEQATEVASTLSEIMGKQFIPCDNGSGTSHRFGVMEQPQIGDDVSKGFNGDYYYVGKIVRITPTLRVVVEDEHGNQKTFSRQKQSSGWKLTSGTWWMVSGIHNEQNPHF